VRRTRHRPTRPSRNDFAAADRQPRLGAGRTGRRLGDGHDLGGVVPAFGVDESGQRLADQLGLGVAQEVLGRRVRLDDSFRGRVDHDDGFAGHLKQQAMTELGVPKSGVVALHDLLGLLKTQLGDRGRPIVAADGEDVAVPPAVHRQVAHHDRVGVGRDLIEFAPGCAPVAHRVAQQLRDLVPAVDGHRVGPPLIEPGRRAIAGQIIAVQRDVPDIPAAVDQHDHIAARGDDPGRGHGIQLSQLTEGKRRSLRDIRRKWGFLCVHREETAFEQIAPPLCSRHAP
jgi:hypothetical protein